MRGALYAISIAAGVFRPRVVLLVQVDTLGKPYDMVHVVSAEAAMLKSCDCNVRPDWLLKIIAIDCYRSRHWRNCARDKILATLIANTGDIDRQYSAC